MAAVEVMGVRRTADGIIELDFYYGDYGQWRFPLTRDAARTLTDALTRALGDEPRDPPEHFTDAQIQEIGRRLGERTALHGSGI